MSFKRIAAHAALSMCGLTACGGGAGGGSAGADAGRADTTAHAAAASPAPRAGWTRLADMPAGVAKFGVAALGNRIYVVGGYDTRRSVMVYDVASNTWSTAPNLVRGTDNVAALATTTRLYAVGGEAARSLQLLDPAARSWTLGPAIPTVRFASAAAVLGTRLHVVGGWNTNNSASASLATHAVFDTVTQTWGEAAPLATARNAAAAAVLQGRLHVFGGRAPGIRSNDQTSMASMEVYDPATDRWSAGPALPTPRAGLGAVVLDGRLYALGGESTPGGVSDAVERYEPGSRAWVQLEPMPYRGHGLGAVVVGGAIYVMGGFTAPSDSVGSETPALYRYQPPQ